MYPRKISQTIVSSHNLKNVLLENFHRHYFIKYSLMIRQKVSDIKNIKEVNKKLQDFLKNGKFFNMIVVRYPESKNGCKNVLKIWAHHCECVIAQRIRRCQQMFCLYSKWWEERALKDFIRTMRQTITNKGKELALGAIGISAYNWEENRISDDSLKEHVNELDYIYELKENTICLKCDATNKKKSDSVVCKCGTIGASKQTYDQWTTFIEKNDLVVWKRLHPSGNFEYKVYGSYDDVSAEDFLNVQIDIDYRRKWDTTAVMLEVAETDETPNSNSDIIYWEMLWPRLFVNRDYVFNRRYLVDKEVNTIYIISKSTEHPNFPKYPEKYRIEDYFSCMVIKPYTEMDKPGIEFSLTYFDNPGVNIPSSVTTWVSMRAMPDFLERLRIATKTYRDYCLKEGVSKACDTAKQKAKLSEEEKLEYCAFKSKPKLEAPDTKSNVQDKKAKPSSKYSVNTE